VPAGRRPVLAAGQSLFTLEGPDIVLTTLKPAERGSGLVTRVLNPTDTPREATLRWNMPVRDMFAVRLDEEPVETDPLTSEAIDATGLGLQVARHSVRTVRVEPSGTERSAD